MIINDAILTVFITAAVAADLRTRRIPNALTLGMVAVALLINVAGYGAGGAGFALKGCASGIALLLIPFAAGGIGGGDVKMLAAVGALKGATFVFEAFLFTAIAGGIFAVAAILLKKEKNASLQEYKNAILNLISGSRPLETLERDSKQRHAMPYAVAIAAGTIAALALPLRIFG